MNNIFNQKTLDNFEKLLKNQVKWDNPPNYFQRKEKWWNECKCHLDYGIFDYKCDACPFNFIVLKIRDLMFKGIELSCPQLKWMKNEKPNCCNGRMDHGGGRFGPRIDDAPILDAVNKPTAVLLINLGSGAILQSKKHNTRNKIEL